jgi:hypothetical protein
VEFIYLTEEVFEFCSIGIDYLLDGRGYKSNSIGLNAGGNANTNSAKLNRVSLDYTNNKHNSKTKVLATL